MLLHLCYFDPLQFAYRPNRSTDDAISQVLHSSLTSHSKNGNYVMLLFIDYSSAFNTIVPTKLSDKLTDLGLNTSLCDWIQDFLTARPQVVKVGQFTSNSITLNIGAPQGCVLSPLLYSLYTHDCVSSHSSTSIVKCADDTVVLGLINNDDKAAYLDEVERLTSWCQDNCLSLNVSKTKELIVDFRKRQQPYTPLMISGTPVERVSSFKYLGVNISDDLTWTTHIQTQVKKARQRLYHLRQLRKFRVSPAILKTFYSGAIESVLISGSALPSLQDIYLKRCKSRAAKILKDSTHPGNHLFCLLPSGKRFRSVMAKTERLRRSFFPQAIRLLTQTQFHKHLQDPLLTVNILIFSLLLLYVQYPEQPVCTSLLFTLLFIKSQYTVFFFFAHLIVFLHILLFCTSYCFALFISLHILLLFLFFYHIYALVLCYFI